MLRTLKDLESYKVSAVDGDIGRVTDFLFDDQQWTIRYLVTDTSGSGEKAHQVLISPISFRRVDWATRLFHLGLTQEKVKNSPSVDLAKPVSRQYERAYSEYYGWPSYWTTGAIGAWNMGAYPSALADSSMKEELQPNEEAHNDPHLRSAKEVAGYHVHGSDGQIGHIADFIVDDESWAIRYLVVDTSNWWLGKKVLVAPHWAQNVSWAESRVYLNLTRDQIKNSPTWSPDALVNRAYEERLYDYYGRPGYWSRDDAEEKGSVVPREEKHPVV